MSEKDDVEIVLLRSWSPSGSLTRSMRGRKVNFPQQSQSLKVRRERCQIGGHNLRLKRIRLETDEAETVRVRPLNNKLLMPSLKARRSERRKRVKYVPEFAGVVVDAFELRVHVVLSLKKSVKLGLLVWQEAMKKLRLSNVDTRHNDF